MVKNIGALLLGVLGGIVAVITVIPGIIFLWKVIIKPLLFPTNTKKYKGEKTYCIVTGAAGGIGKAFAEKFAKEGFNLIIMDRLAEPLAELKKMLEEKYNVTVVDYVADFIAMDKNNEWNKVEELIANYDIGVLVNNVGMCNYLPGKFGQLELKDINNMISLNIRTLLMMTHICIPKMEGRKEKGLIVNMSSSTSGYPHPLIQVYSSTKAFVRQFTDSIYAEYKGKIDVIAYTPWYIKTDMTKIRENAIYALTPSDFVDYAFRYFGQQNHINPYWFHYLMDIGTSTIPEAIFSKSVIKQQTFVRKRLQMKLEQQMAEAASKKTE
ncbi:estradiol 17-beta-dehydrogenase, putative [Entamoeba histolytica HM-1:IMSS-B]|uniref:Short chain dehydrogenase family protein n=6 Tax=Entamoeba histolytica TaxID=5759 RepID=C4M1Y9_ENTH1|nr:short chain dehydrogenase family protein [Entamoeba histolytica HM-1:IMSS]EMD49110.1 short chain dehydrogenase family protein [Entamoeba histolytica KU27]EMH77279.1 estradiol 17-beta-dehydrogenase, putative [Entamoeba histolytica HM-1:IMSS-B]EMS16784.1 short chain dehydrogenase family protein [Entamoeba histolytica HM-3:IMSS]ENY62548.1 short chain dehydrogenase family protein, putative [Entamoeba histolytica HM-1:IMSS-A]GAT95262.1 estradiol 17-beta-dehydrogenase putative [Entamoeba histolyt|eukprot:XP_652218.1 short chain dehydrogenase family protein [Entamoeba histolytica HM-1:IMSS]